MTVATPKPRSCEASPPIFLVGSERSGTTLLRLMLNGHPEIAFHPEAEYIVDRIAADGTLPPIDEYHAYLPTQLAFRTSGFIVDRGLSYSELVRSFVEQKRRRDAKPHVDATVHHAFDRLPYVFPEARYIHLLRDGRDVSRSVVAMGWAGNAWHGSVVWREAEQAWEQLATRLRPDQHITVRYEDLIADATQTLTSVCEFLGVSFDQGLFQYEKTSTYDLPDPKFIAQWRHKSSAREVRAIESQVGDVLVARGYELSEARRKIGALGRARLRLDSRLRRAMFRMRPYGAMTHLQFALCRRLGLRQMADRAAARMAEVDWAYIR